MALSRSLPIELIRIILELFCQDLVERYAQFKYIRFERIPRGFNFFFPAEANFDLGNPLADYVNCHLVCSFFDDILNGFTVKHTTLSDSNFYRGMLMYLGGVQLSEVLQIIQYDILINLTGSLKSLQKFGKFSAGLRTWGVAANFWKNPTIEYNESFFTAMFLKTNRQERAILLSLTPEWLNENHYFMNLKSRQHLEPRIMIIKDKSITSTLSLRLGPPYGMLNKHFALYIFEGFTRITIDDDPTIDPELAVNMPFGSGLPTNDEIRRSRGRWWVFQNRANPSRDWNIINHEEKKLYVGPEGTLAPFYSSWPSTT